MNYLHAQNFGWKEIFIVNGVSEGGNTKQSKSIPHRKNGQSIFDLNEQNEKVKRGPEGPQLIHAV